MGNGLETQEMSAKCYMKEKAIRIAFLIVINLGAAKNALRPSSDLYSCIHFLLSGVSSDTYNRI